MYNYFILAASSKAVLYATMFVYKLTRLFHTVKSVLVKL